MATKLYITTGLSTPFDIQGTWEISTGGSTIPLSLVKSGGPISSKSTSEGTSAVPNDIFQLQLVSPKLGAQTFTGDLTFTIGVKAPYDTSRYYWHVHAYVSQGDTNLVRGTLINNYRENTTNHWPNIQQSSIPVLSIPLNAGVTSVAGDRIIVELGYISRAIPAFTRIQGTGKVKASGPVSQIQLTFPSTPVVGNGIVVLMAGQKDTAGMNFGTCTDNAGNSYSIALTQRRISTNGEYAIVMYYCSKIISTAIPLTITITGDGTDHAFEGCAVEIGGLNGGLLSLNSASSNSPATASINVTTGSPGTVTGLALIAGLFARFGATSSIAVENIAPPNYTQEYEELLGVWLTDIAGEADLKLVDSTTETVRTNWIMGTSGNVAAGVASFIRTSPVLGTGDLFFGAPVGSADLVHPSTAVGTNAGSITFSQNLLFEGTANEVAHVVEQVAQVLPPPELQLAHTVIQAAKPAPPPVHLAHIVEQVAQPAPPGPSYLAHTIAQVAEVLPSTTARISHAIIQVVPIQVAALPDLSGLYYLNPTKSFYHDSYYNSTELKIPDPTIKTAFLGE